MATLTEIELKFLVPRGARAALAEELGRPSASLERATLRALYLDTPDRRLARAGIAWRLRREGTRWIQTLKGHGASAIERFEHEVIRPGPTHDESAHAGTPVGEKLAAILEAARREGLEVEVRFQTEVQRISRRIRTRGALVEVAFDEGRLLAGDAKLRLRELEFELVSGSALAMLRLAERWRKRFGLVYDPRSKAERGDRLARGLAFPAVRKARPTGYPADADASSALGAVLDECLGHICRNAIGLPEGDESRRVEHVHQLRVGIRRLRSALRAFEGWTPTAPAALRDDLHWLFQEIGRVRDSDVLESGVAADLRAAGAPPLRLLAGVAGADPVALVADPRTQRMLLGWIAWRVGLAEPAEALAETARTVHDETDEATAVAAPSVDAIDPDGPESVTHAGGEDVPTDAASPDDGTGGGDGATGLRRRAGERVRQWHRRIAADWKRFDQLDEKGLHALRKRIKRQRYAVEFFAPVLRRKAVAHYLAPLMTTQERLGKLNDLFVARTRYRALLDAEPSAWFALGWLAARIEQTGKRARRALKKLAKTRPPDAVGSQDDKPCP